MLFTIQLEIVALVILVCYLLFRAPVIPPAESAYTTQRRALAQSRSIQAKTASSSIDIVPTDPPIDLAHGGILTRANDGVIDSSINSQPADAVDIGVMDGLPTDAVNNRVMDVQPIDAVDTQVMDELPIDAKVMDSSFIDAGNESIGPIAADDAAVEEFKQNLDQCWRTSASQEHVLL